MRSVAVIGASLAGLRAAQALRAQGFDGELTIIGAEAHLPYDRPPLSKDFLAGRSSEAALALVDDEDVRDLDARWRLGVHAKRLHRPKITLSDGTEETADGLVIATGAAPRRLPGSDGLAGVHVLRDVEHARALHAELVLGPKVVVVGGGFIGAEVASTCATLGCPVTVVEAMPVPMAQALGTQIATVCAQLPAEHGVEMRTNVGVARILSSSGRATGVALTDGTVLDADVVVVGIGARPATDWLADSGLRLADGVVTDEGGVTDDPTIVAVGDVARYGRARYEHWTSAGEQASVAVTNLLAGKTIATHRPSGYVWSDQYGVRLQLAGSVRPDDTVRIIDGAVDDRKFVATYHRDEKTVGVFAMNNPRIFAKVRRSGLS